MKSIFERVILLVGILMFVTTVNVQALPYSTMDVMSSFITVGDTFDIQVSMNRDNLSEELLAFGFDVSTGLGTLFSFSGYTIGAGFEDFSSGGTNISGIAFPGISDDSVLLATLTFTALTAGTDTLSVLGIYDNMFSGAYYEVSGFDISSALDITINSANTNSPVPEPATMLLLGTGLLGLAGFRKKLKQ